jgi:glycosyltransferase involved in cell wall biosynthesis
MGLIDRIELLPELSESEIASLCLSAKLHMHPIHEAFGMQVLEASAVGCPSIIVQGSGAAELYEHRVSGLHPMDNIESFAAEIDWAFADDGRLRELSYAAYKVAIKHSWVNHSKKLVKICKSAFL